MNKKSAEVAFAAYAVATAMTRQRHRHRRHHSRNERRRSSKHESRKLDLHRQRDESLTEQTEMGEYVIRNRDDLVEALRSRKDELGLSNAFVEAQLQMGDSACDKILGPSQAKGMSIPVMLDMIELFGARLVIQVDAETEARMQERWERRDAGKVHPPRRLSAHLMRIARAQLYLGLSELGNKARKAKLPPEARSRIARAAAISRWRRHRAAVKAASLSEGVQA
jgi:hypothetical protein